MTVFPPVRIADPVSSRILSGSIPAALSSALIPSCSNQFARSSGLSQVRVSRAVWALVSTTLFALHLPTDESPPDIVSRQCIDGDYECPRCAGSRYCEVVEVADRRVQGAVGELAGQDLTRCQRRGLLAVDEHSSMTDARLRFGSQHLDLRFGEEDLAETTEADLPGAGGFKPAVQFRRGRRLQEPRLGAGVDQQVDVPALPMPPARGQDGPAADYPAAPVRRSRRDVRVEDSACAAEEGPGGLRQRQVFRLGLSGHRRASGFNSLATCGWSAFAL